MIAKSLRTIALSLGLLGVPHVFAKKHTNFVLILMDDMGYGDLRVNGAIGYETPNIDQLVKQGMIFTKYYAPQAVSGASRAGLMTGCYPNRIGLTGAPFPGSMHGLHENEMTIAEVLKQKGYNCAAYGKWHIGEHPQFLPMQNGFDEFYGIPYSNDMWPNHPTLNFPDLPLIEGESIIEHNPDQRYFTKNFTDRSVDFITRNRKTPFFLYLAHPMPHVPLFVSDKFKGKSTQGLYGDVMMELDWSIGEIAKTLKKEGLDENTLLILLSDNGPWLNYGNHAGSTGGLREGKGTSFEGGQRVPCIMKWTGKIPAGSVCNNMIAGMDILPTIAAIANAPLPQHTIDGVNIMPLFEQTPNSNPRKSFYYYYRQNDLEAVTDGDFKLVFPHNHRTYEDFLPGNNGIPGTVNERFPLKDTLLFDLRRDPGERYNVISQNRKILKKLECMAQEAREELGDNLTRTIGTGVRPVGTIKTDDIH